MRIKEFLKNVRILVVMALVILVMATCIEIVGVEQPGSANAGEQITTIIHATMEPYYDQPQSRLIVGFLAPKSWNAASTLEISYTSNIGNGTMRPVSATAKPVSSAKTWPDAIMEKIGIGGNYIPDMEWIVFQSDRAYDQAEGSPGITATITLKVKTGMQNLQAKLGYFVGSSQQDLSDPKYYGAYFSDCFQVLNGTGDMIDFCNPPISTVLPTSVTDNDIVTISFDNDLVPTRLSDASEVFLYATAVTTTSDTIKVEESAEKTALTQIGGGKWRIDFWPRQFFDLKPGQVIDHILYNFADKTGSIHVYNQGDTGDDFIKTLICK